MWMANAETANLRIETIEQQFLATKVFVVACGCAPPLFSPKVGPQNATNTSVVCQYGNRTLGRLPVADFLAGPKNGSLLVVNFHFFFSLCGLLIDLAQADLTHNC
jgi:hypothetical protein